MRVVLAARTRRAPLLLALLLLVTLVGCFSTTPPDVSDPSNEPQDDPSAAVIRGLTLHWLGPGEVRRRSDWSVEVRWYKGGQPTRENRIMRTVRRSDNNAVYEFSIKDPRVTWVQVRAVLCSFDPNDASFECCLSVNNPCGDCPQVWDDWTTRQIVPGLHLNGVDLKVPCGS